MPRFPTAQDAYRWAMELLIVRGSPRAIQYDPDWIGALGVSLDYAVLDAINIKRFIDRRDINNGRASWFECYYLPDPIEPPRAFTCHEMITLTKAIQEFEHDLCQAGFIPKCGKQCVRKKKIDRIEKVGA